MELATKFAISLSILVAPSVSASMHNNSEIIKAISSEYTNISIGASTDSDLLGYADSKDGTEVAFFYASKDSGLIEIGEKLFQISSTGGLENVSISKDFELYKNTLFNLSQSKGFYFNDKGEKSALVMLDTSCQYSRRFVKSGGLKRLVDSGYKVMIVPFSRMINGGTISRYAGLVCSDRSDAEKSDIFLKNLAKGTDVPLSHSPTNTCNYWESLKVFYGLFYEMEVEGVPAIVLSDSNEIRYSF
ncbi:TPA: hypothetical protein I7730_16335 [Vibrio vulnificus]|uniref:Uncharacterized protein n=1 Tax=Vibrio vulnificus TaxID=672 RepID=A0A8H9N223_VIBVL|nr:hypothetical protein [Vibrio vulnificus]HAS8541353.1 hypothetical protein [Vibrio vulnificus]